jgi:hypothetical protein
MSAGNRLKPTHTQRNWGCVSNVHTPISHTKDQTNEGKKQMSNTKRQLRLSDIDALKTLLEKIWALGDKDEMSIKHIGHGLAGLATYGTHKAALDYELPNVEMTDRQLEALSEYWQQVKEFLHGVSREELVSVFEYLPIAVYGAIYLDTHADYYKEKGN